MNERLSRLSTTFNSDLVDFSWSGVKVSLARLSGFESGPVDTQLLWITVSPVDTFPIYVFWIYNVVIS